MRTGYIGKINGEDVYVNARPISEATYEQQSKYNSAIEEILKIFSKISNEVSEVKSINYHSQKSISKAI